MRFVKHVCFFGYPIWMPNYNRLIKTQKQKQLFRETAIHFFAFNRKLNNFWLFVAVITILKQKFYRFKFTSRCNQRIMMIRVKRLGLFTRSVSLLQMWYLLINVPSILSEQLTCIMLIITILSYINACVLRCSSSASVYRLHAGSNDKYGGVYYPVKRIVRHPAYNFLTIDYDIALLEVTSNPISFLFSFSPSLRAISLFLLVNDSAPADNNNIGSSRTLWKFHFRSTAKSHLTTGCSQWSCRKRNSRVVLWWTLPDGVRRRWVRGE